ncbi:unnamed protein product [Penicillium salamii]|uniref:Uncharacterized protein n=1 Tax=Penicillium salamii TaxID=1612424 RepID=A0A9W4JXY8_9EURO|nr:unnamed protein product [Penicillium salamii]
MSASEIAAISLEAPNHTDLTELGLEYRKRGAELQAWIADPTAPGCNVQQKIHKWETLLGNDMKKWDPNTAHTTNLELMDDSLPIQRGWAGPPLEVGNVHKIGLSHNNVYRQIVWQPSGLDANGEQVMNTWRQDTGLGAIFARDILRRFGAYWGEVCQAQYTIDNPIETLKYVFVINCVNEETWPYVMDLYYRKNLSYDDPLFPAVVWQWDSPEYQEILGTTIGRGVARLVLGSFPRGTRRIHRILTWTHNAQLQLRFEIVEVNPTSAAV